MKITKRIAGPRDRERFCDRCHRTESHPTRFNNWTRTALRCQPNGTMICSNCQAAHNAARKSEKTANEFPTGYKVFPIIIEPEPIKKHTIPTREEARLREILGL